MIYSPIDTYRHIQSTLNLLASHHLLPIQHVIQLPVEFPEGLGVNAIEVDLAASSSKFLVPFTAIFLDHVDDVSQLLLTQLFQSLMEAILLGLWNLINFCRFWLVGELM